MIKKAGIVTDNYKVDKFIEELAKKGYTDLEIASFKGKTSTIRVEIPEEKTEEIKKMCQSIELFFKSNLN